MEQASQEIQDKVQSFSNELNALFQKHGFKYGIAIIEAQPGVTTYVDISCSPWEKAGLLYFAQKDLDQKTAMIIQQRMMREAQMAAQQKKEGLVLG